MACSPSAITLTSLSTTTTSPRLGGTKPGTSNPSQPGMIGGFVGRPVACSTGPGSPMPTPAMSRGRRPAAATSRRPCSTTQRQHVLRTEGDVEVDELVGQHGRRQVGDGQPDVGGADVGGEHDARRRVEGELRRRATTRRRRLAGRRRRAQLASSASTRWATVDRPSPVTAASSLRVRGTPSRRCCSRIAGTVHRTRVKHTTSACQRNFCLTTGRSW